MTSNHHNKLTPNTTPDTSRFIRFAAAALMALALIPAFGKDRERDDHERDDHGRDRDRDRDGEYAQTNLVADLAGVAQLQDTNLVNAWGISFSATTPFWVSDNGTGKSTLYAVTNDASGAPHVVKQSLEVNIPGDGSVSGQTFNSLGGFNGDIFIFASEDGTISGWRGALGANAEVLTTRTNGVYKGITIVSNTSGVMLLAANFAEGTIDVYNPSMTLVAQYSDPHAPTGYAPFNVQALQGTVFVTYAKQDPAKHDDDAGPGRGLIDILNPQTGAFHRLATGSAAGGHNHDLNSPWGLALAPASFGAHGDQLMVGNFGSGTIMAFEADGDFRGLLEGAHEKPIVIDGLWGLAFGNGTRAGVTNALYFSAGPAGESHGLFGSLVPMPEEEHGHHDRDCDRH